MSKMMKGSLFMESEKFHVRLENLPWSACHGDILKFFEDVSVPHGGVSIRSKDVIVALKNSNDLDQALLKTEESLNGNTIYISKLCTNQLRKMYRQNIRRVLSFTHVPERQSISYKRIRPTSKIINESEMFNVFNPEECDSHEIKSVVRENVSPYKTKRKIKPTHMKDILNNRYLFIGEYDDCSGRCTKRMKLDENIRIATMIAVT